MNLANQVKIHYFGIFQTCLKFPGSFQGIPKPILPESKKSIFNPCFISPSVWRQILLDMSCWNIFPMILPHFLTLLFISREENSCRRLYHFYSNCSTPIPPLFYTGENTSFLLAMAQHLLLPEIHKIRNLISFPMGKPHMIIIRFIW